MFRGLLGLCLILVLGIGNRCMATERPKYSAELSEPPFEVRQYAPTVVAEVHVDGTREEAVNTGFRILAGYIFGNNEAQQKVAMTAPVTQQTPSEKIAMTAPVNQVHTIGGFLVQFTMPVGFTLATLPEPNDSRVHLREIPAHRVAVKAYTGSWSEAHYQRKLAELRSALKRDGVRTTGEPVFARFNSPFQIWFLRRNEIWIEVAP